MEEIGEAPCSFAFIGLGSVGRKEQTLATDQDNAIIFDDEMTGNEEVIAYFKLFAEKVNTHLKSLGYQLCKGEVMARNPKWTQPLRMWKKYFTEWINSADPQSVLDACIFFDFRCLYGDEQFISDLNKHVNETVENKAVFFQHMTASVMNWKSPVTIFGSIVGISKSESEDIFDIKKVLLPLTSFIRIYSIKNKISETNSLKRLDELQKSEIIKSPLYDELKMAYNYLMLMRFRSQAEQLFEGLMPDNFIKVSKLNDIEITTLKKVFSHIAELQTKVSFDFKGSA